MFCPNCAGELAPVAPEEFVSEDLWGGDYYTHFCPVCPAYWHLHINGDGGVDLISTGSNQEVSNKKITKDLVTVLRDKATKLGAV